MADTMTEPAIGSTKSLRWRPALAHDAAMQLAASEYERVLEMLGQIEDWQAPTECTDWDVRQLVAHMVGMAEMWSTNREFVHQMRLTGKGNVDVMTELQVRDRAQAAPAELIERLRKAAPRATRRRHRFSRVMGRRLMPMAQELPGSGPEWWSFGYLTDTILTRDPWMHRADLSRASGVRLNLTPDHDGVIVADVVAEWGQRHGQPFRLRLTGPAGGSWDAGTGGPEIEMDAVEFCRTLSGRQGGAGLLAVPVPF
jgi:uncharacterized protein (TIGR03083 family)